MNRDNKYFSDQDISTHVFSQTQHSSIINRTRTKLSGPNVELIKSNTLPVPVISTKHMKKIKDPVKEFIKTKNDYNREKTMLEAKLVKYYRTKKISRENNVTNQNLREYIAYKFLDPVPYIDPFDCFYFYPHRGTMHCFETEDNEYLAHIVHNGDIRFDEIRGMQFKHFDAVFEKSSPPTELIINDNSDFIAARYRNVVETAKLPDALNHCSKIETVHEFKHKNDIFASALNGCFLSTIDSKYILRRFNLVHQFEDVNVKLTDYYVDEKLLPISLSTPPNNTLTANCASFTTRYNFGLMDFRCKKKVAIENHFSSNDMTMKCEKIFNHANSLLSKDLVYIASSHLLYTLDYRKLKEPVVYWTHQLYEPAMMLSTTMYGLNEIICASSHMAGDLKVFNNNGKSINYYPYKPYSIRNSYNKLREQGLFLLSDNIKERVDGSITGIALYSDTIRSKIKLFTQNCYGDIYENVLNCKEVSNDDGLLSTIESFQVWENSMSVPLNPNKQLTTNERIKNGDLIVDDIVKFKNLPKYLNDEKSNEIVDFTNLDPENFLTLKPDWQVNIGEAKECNDLLAKEIMYLWNDIDESYEEAENGQEEELGDLSQEVKGTDKVSRWLESTAIMQDEDMDDEFSPEIVSTQAPLSAKKKSRITGF